MAKEGNSIRRRLRSVLSKRIPILGWIGSYTRQDAISDLVAGITISLTMIPQSIAYASLADLSPKTGMNSAFMGCFIYVFFGTIKEVVIGPTSLMALLTFEYTHQYNLDFVVLLCFLCGVVELIMGLLRLGFLVEFISVPVVSGFTTATSIIIVVSQIKGIIGVRFKSKGFVDNIKKLHNNFGGFKKTDIILGVTCIICLLLLRMLKDVKLRKNKLGSNVLMKLFWFLSTGRNALAVVITSWIALSYENSGFHPPFLTTREVEKGLPSIQLPPMSTQIGNHTYEFEDMVHGLGMGIFVIPIVSVLANVAIAKAYAEDSLDGTQEMFTLALCNIFGSLVQSMPTCGAFTRSAVISASGVKTPLAGLYSAGLTLLALKYLAAYFHLIPRATLSAILISAVIFLIDYRIFKPLWRSSKRDFLILVMTLVCCLSFGVEVGLLFGVVAGIVHLVYLWSKPHLEHSHCQKGGANYVVVTPRLGLFYPSMTFVHSEIMRIGSEYDGLPLVINCGNFTGIDYTAVKSLHNLSNAFAKREQRLVFINVPNNFIHIWKSSGCGKLDLLSSEDLEAKLSGTGIQEEKDGSTTISIIKDSDRRVSAHETIDLLQKEKDIQ